MNVYRLVATVSVSAYTDIAAPSLAEAIRIAACRDVQLGGPGSDAHSDDSWVIDDADGVPRDIQEGE